MEYQLSELQQAILTNQEHNRSDRYKLFTTQDALDCFLPFGWTISSMSQNRARKDSPSRVGHLVRLRHELFKIGEDYVEIVISNSYNGSSSFKINLGVYRLVCSNGLIVGTNFFERRIPHLGDAVRLINDSIGDAVSQITKFTYLVQSLKERQLTDQEKNDFISKLYTERLKNVDGFKIIDFDRSTRIRREADRGNSAWQVLNVAQEYILQGGIVYKTIDNQGNVSNNTTSRIRDVRKQLQLNQLCFNEAIKIAA